MRKTESKDISGTKYETTQLGALAGREALVRLMKLLGPMIESGNPGAVVSQMAPADMTYFCDLFMAHTTVYLADGKSPRLKEVFDLHFAGNYGDMLLWLVFCIEVNFSDFFPKLGALLRETAGKASL